MKKILKPVSIFAGMLIFGTALLFAGKFAVQYRAREVALHFAEKAMKRQSVENRTLAVAAAVFELYKVSDGSAPPLLARLRPYLTNSLIPEPLRIEDGAIDAILLEGMCDSATRATMYVLSTIGIDSRQLNLISAHGGAHTVLEVSRKDGSRFLVDPIFGLAPREDGRVLGVEEVRTLIGTGKNPREVWSPISPKAEYNIIYDHFARMWISPQGAPLKWQVEVDLTDKGGFDLGVVNGSPWDVAEDGPKHGLTVYWHYLGHRYDRGWVREMKFSVPTEVVFVLTKPVNSDFITTEQKPFSVEGNEVHYIVEAGEVLTFHDGWARRDVLTLKSYQDVDMISFKRLDGG